MRAPRTALALTIVAAAGCSGGHSKVVTGPYPPQPAGVYVAHIVIRHRAPSHFAGGQTMTVWLDTATGRFRIRTAYRGSEATVAAYDGRVGTMAFGPRARKQVWVYRGSATFVAHQLGYVPIAALREYLSGSPGRAGIRVHVRRRGWPAAITAATAYEHVTLAVQPLASAPADLFRTARGRVIVTTRQVSAGTQPPSGVPAYWLGASWSGRPASGASEWSGRSGGGYTVSYRGLDVDSSTSLPEPDGASEVTLADGTRAGLAVLPLGPDGTYSISSSTSTSGGSETLGIVQFTQSEGPGSTVALVFLPHAMITLSGPAVSRRSAAAIARALRPL